MRKLFLSFLPALFYSAFMFHRPPQVADSLIVFALCGFSASLFYLDYLYNKTKDDRSEEMIRIENEIKIEQLKANLIDTKFYSARQHAKRDEEAVLGTAKRHLF